MRLLRMKYLWIAIPAVVLAGAIYGGTTMKRTKSVMVPPGTEIRVRLEHSISTKSGASGDPFEATLAEPIAIDGKTVLPKDTPVKGRIVYAHESGRLKGVARLRLTLESAQVDGEEYDLHTDTWARRGGNHKKRNWAMIGGGGAGGALIGALAGGGKGALIGGPIGAGAGVAASALTGKKDFTLPAETLLTFELTQPLEVQVKS